MGTPTLGLYQPRASQLNTHNTHNTFGAERAHPLESHGAHASGLEREGARGCAGWVGLTRCATIKREINTRYSSKVLGPAHGGGRAGAGRHALPCAPRAPAARDRGRRRSPRAAAARARVSQVSPWCLPRGRSHAHERGSNAQRAPAQRSRAEAASSRSMHSHRRRSLRPSCP